MNKYQEALDYLDRRTLTKRDDGLEIHEEQVKTLQELIDNYSKIQQFDRAIYFNADGVVVNGISYEQLEKALDKACDWIYTTDEDFKKICPKGVATKDQWKDYLLSEVSK